MCEEEGQGGRTEQAEEGDDGDGAEGRLHRRAELAREQIGQREELHLVEPVQGKARTHE